MTITRLLLCKLAGFAAGLAFSCSTLAQTVWELPSGYGSNTFQVQNLQQFANRVNRATAGKLQFNIRADAKLFKVNEIKRAVQSGRVPIGEFILSSASEEAPIFGLDSIPFLATSYSEIKRLNDISRPLLEKTLEAQGMRLLFASPWPPQGLYANKPVKTLQDLRGTRMRTYNAATQSIALALGAHPVTIQLSDLRAALENGEIDNFLTSSASGVESQLHQKMRYFYDVSAWAPRNAVVVNQKFFDALEPDVREALLQQAAAAELRGWRLSQQRDGEYIRELATKGMKIDTISEGLKKELRAIGERMTQEWVLQTGEEGRLIIEAYRKK
jgi:TRAP-type transport system periplasmic protein